MPKIELHIGALPIHVRTARLVAAALGRRIGLDAVVIDEVKLAVGEACSRAVIVHRSAGAAEPIVVTFRDDDDILEVAVVDCGPGGAKLPSGELAGDSYASYDAALASDLDGAGLAPGLGLAMIAGLVDDVSVDDRTESGKAGAAPGSTGTVVTMRWPIVSF